MHRRERSRPLLDSLELKEMIFRLIEFSIKILNYNKISLKHIEVYYRANQKKITLLILKKLYMIIKRILVFSSLWEKNMEKHTFFRGKIICFKKGS